MDPPTGEIILALSSSRLPPVQRIELLFLPVKKCAAVRGIGSPNAMSKFNKGASRLNTRNNEYAYS